MRVSEVVALTVAYDGAPFAGFARQDGPETVQGRLERALATILRTPVATVGAGRTDAGVHALGQVVSFDATGLEPQDAVLARSLNALAGPEIAVGAVRRALEGFSARHDAIAREYRYRIVTAGTPPVFLARVAWHTARELDADAMRAAAGVLVGEHDFRSFCVAESAEGKHTVRRIDAVELAMADDLGEPHLVVRVVGNAFLHSMVRVIVGSLVEVGRGARPSDWLAEALAARDRAVAGPTAPAHGLTLWKVEYPDEVWSSSPAAPAGD
ncbi:MAG: tRNA pseudouridine(38-40) synthase TruA [Coriobacteriaceae bacterium]|nr:tRNA pseudouridine(38-40) synthase TruA [Coriobacteriaceae bacterium]